MNRFAGLYFTLIFLSAHFRFQAQNTQTIHFSKNSDRIYFFQIGNRNDSVIQHKSDRFYFVVADSLKKSITLHIDNGKFEKTENDSILKLQFLPGMKYETLYHLASEHRHKTEGSRSIYELKTLVNGASEFDRKKIRIRLTDNRSNELLIENVFVYKN